jgi:hypothetical protein
MRLNMTFAHLTFENQRVFGIVDLYEQVSELEPNVSHQRMIMIPRHPGYVYCQMSNVVAVPRIQTDLTRSARHVPPGAGHKKSSVNHRLACMISWVFFTSICGFIKDNKGIVTLIRSEPWICLGVIA